MCKSTYSSFNIFLSRQVFPIPFSHYDIFLLFPNQVLCYFIVFLSLFLFLSILFLFLFFSFPFFHFSNHTIYVSISFLICDVDPKSGKQGTRVSGEKDILTKNYKGKGKRSLLSGGVQYW